MLYALRRRGQATADDIARQLDMTVSGARQHLTALVDDGLAEATELPAPARAARPRAARRTWSPTAPTRCSRRPTASSPTSCSATRRRPTPVSSTRCSRAAATSASATRPSGSARKRTLKAKVAELTRILDDDGYLATCEDVAPGVFRIVEHNCAIWAVAQRYGQACTSELDFIRAVLPDADVERVQHMVAGAPHCAYEVRARPTAGELTGAATSAACGTSDPGMQPPAAARRCSSRCERWVP